MGIQKLNQAVRWASWLWLGCCASIVCAEAPVVGESPDTKQGPAAALGFERSFRDPQYYGDSKPIELGDCSNITELTTDLWSKKDVLRDFKRHRTDDQIGVIVFVKTEICCGGSRLCAVTTACMEKKSTPLVGRFRVYGGWIKENPDHTGEQWSDWEANVINEYGFVQGPGARVVVMVPTWDGKMYQWESDATDLELSQWDFQRREGRTPALDEFLATAVKWAPTELPPAGQAEVGAEQ